MASDVTPPEPAASPPKQGSFVRVLSPGEVLLLTISALSPVLSVFIGGNAILHMAGTGAATGFIGGSILAALMALLLAVFVAAFFWHEWSIRTGRETVQLNGIDLV